MNQQPVYLDHAATTPLDPRVLEAMLPYLRGDYGNPSSAHRLGRKARFIVEEARERIANVIGAEPGEIVFTSGGTEADNLAIRGFMGMHSKGCLVTCAAEHEAVLRAAEAVNGDGGRVKLLAPEAGGAVSVDAVKDALSLEAITHDAAMVSIMHANNEVGAISSIEAIAGLCRDFDVPLHTDAVQTVGMLDIDVTQLGVDMLSASAHKFYGPKGVGFLFVRGGVELAPLIRGGSQERRRRGGTENVAGIVGMARALELAHDEKSERYKHALGLKRRLLRHLADDLAGQYRISGTTDDAQAIPNITHIHFPPIEGKPLDGEMLLLNLDMEGILVSSGSACTSGAIEPSHVLLAMGIDPAAAQAAVRISTGVSTTEAEIDRAVDVLGRVVRRMRNQAAA